MHENTHNTKKHLTFELLPKTYLECSNKLLEKTNNLDEFGVHFWASFMSSLQNFLLLPPIHGTISDINS